MFPLRAYIDLYFDSWKSAVRQNIVVHGKGAKKKANITQLALPSRISQIVVHGKGAKKKANIISYCLMTSEWHPCLFNCMFYESESLHVQHSRSSTQSLGSVLPCIVGGRP